MYKGQIEGFPKEVVEKMLEYQVEQGHPRDVSVFETFREASKRNKGFDWYLAPEKHDFWSNVINHKNFDLFFQRYPKPKPYPKMMRVSNFTDPSENEGCVRCVFMEKRGKFLAWVNAETIEDAEKETKVYTWEYAKDIE